MAAYFIKPARSVCQLSKVNWLEDRVIFYHFCHILWFRSKPQDSLILKERGLYKDLNQEVGIMGATLESVYHLQ